eukprot:COSAG02_NODE_2053_length_9994_cov_7.402628_13_plen_78_part_00
MTGLLGGLHVLELSIHAAQGCRHFFILSSKLHINSRLRIVKSFVGLDAHCHEVFVLLHKVAAESSNFLRKSVVQYVH